MGLGIDIIQIRTSKAYVYQDRENEGYRWKDRQQETAKMQEIRKLAYQGRLTIGSRKRLSKALHVLSEMTPTRKVYNEVSKRAMYFKLSMITLTVPAKERHLTPKEGYQLLLKNFLKWLVRTEGCKGYVWKVEHQKNGQIHYHIIQNVYINYSAIREKWNYLLKRAGLLETLYKEHHHYNPNSTDVHAIRKVKNITAYFISYMKAQKNDSEITSGKVWDCSYNIKKAEYYHESPDKETTENIQKGIKSGNIIKEFTDYCTILTFLKKPAKFYLSKKQFQNHFNHYRQYLYQDLFPPERKKQPKPEKIELEGLLNPS